MDLVSTARIQPLKKGNVARELGIKPDSEDEADLSNNWGVFLSILNSFFTVSVLAKHVNLLKYYVNYV